jgi:predicted DNA-binding ribbon-helix-helix protein
MIRKYSITLHGHRTSFSLEEEFHDRMRAIAAQRGRSLASVIAEVDASRDERDNLSSALRVFVLGQCMRGDGMDTTVIESAATVVPVADLGRSVDFYVGVLGFELEFMADDGSIARVCRDQAKIQLVHTGNADVLDVTANHISIYLTIDGVDDLFETLRPALDSLPAARVSPPRDMAHGRREFHVRDPDRCLLIFGERAGV